MKKILLVVGLVLGCFNLSAEELGTLEQRLREGSIHHEMGMIDDTRRLALEDAKDIITDAYYIDMEEYHRGNVKECPVRSLLKHKYELDDSIEFVDCYTVGVNGNVSLDKSILVVVYSRYKILDYYPSDDIQ